jgi:TonB-linked SusC/RagA family outer membrane protein
MINFMRKKITLFIFLLLASLNIALAQNATVKGKVVDNSGQPLPGVTVTVKGTTNGTLTDVAGKYSISVPPNTTLTFSFVGFASQSVAVGSQTSINVTLADIHNDLNEVVVVGYGTQKKSVVTGAISSVRAADLEKQPVNRIEQALQGRTSGLTIAAASGQPGANASVRLRGITSFSNAKNNPLWVVDGVVIDNGGIGYLNQSDIESIEVLKDAASASIYGARSAAGVILVTTKKGKAGTVSVNYSGYYGTQKPAKKLDMLDATQYATVRNQSLAAAGKPLPYANPSALGAGTDWQALIFNNSAPKQNHEVSISGGNEKSTFYTSFGYNTIDGIVATPISKWNRLNIRLNSTHKIKPWLTIGENLGYSHSVSSGVGATNREFGGPLSSAVNLDPTIPAIVTDPAVISKYYTDPRSVRDANGNLYGIPNADGTTGAFQEMTNPLAYIKTHLGNYSWDHNFVGNAFLEAEPIKGLHLRSTLGTKLSFFGNDAFTPIAYFSASSSNARSTFFREVNTGFAYNFENTVSYNKVFGKHDITFLVGQGNYQDNDQDGYTKRINTTFFDVPATDFNSASFRYKPIAANRTTDASDGTDHKVFSLFSRVQYNYDEKYLLTALVRRDGSSRFGDNKKFGYFPSVGLGWVPTRESFFPTNNVVNTLKIRGSYGVTGNDVFDGDQLAYLSQVNSGRNYPFGSNEAISIGYSPAAIGNPDLKWEQTTSTDIGIDATLFRNFTLSADWYKKKTSGILQTTVIPGYVGYDAPPANVADMENKGFELELGYRNRVGKVDFGVNGNVSFVKNKVTKLLPGVDFIEQSAGTFQTLGNITRSQLGGAFNQFYGFQNLGLFQTQAEVDNYKSPSGKVLQPNAKPGDIKFANLNNDDQINQDDRTYIGNPLPTVTYGITVNVGYAGFDLVAFGSGAGGNQIFQGLRRLDIGAANYQTKILKAWTPSNTNTSVPRLIDGDPNKNYSNFSSVYLESGNYFRLRTLQLGYTLKQSVVKRLGLQKLRVYALSENLFTITKYSGFDPELGISNDTGGGGVFSIDRGFYPQARSFMVGLQVTL